MNPSRGSWWETSPFCGFVRGTEGVGISPQKRTVASRHPEMGGGRRDATFDPYGFRNKEVVHAVTTASPGNYFGLIRHRGKSQQRVPGEPEGDGFREWPPYGISRRLHAFSETVLRTSELTEMKR